MLILFGTFFVTLFLGIPVAFAMGAASVAYLLSAGIPLAVIPQKMFVAMDAFVLLCVVGFILAGNLMNTGGITDRIIRVCNAAFGHICGGLGLVNVAASMVFAGMSGTALADTSSLGAILIPAMKKEGYEADFSVAVTAASSTVGPIIPPSIPMIIVGMLTGLSVSKLFVAGIVPGILMGGGMMVVSYIISKRHGHPKGPRTGFVNFLIEFIKSIWALLLPVVILVGILGGVFTPTEASCMAVVYSFVVGMFVYRELKFRQLPAILFESVCMVAGIMILVGFANLFGWVMASQRIPQLIASSMLSITTNKYLMLLLINLLLLFVGMFMETNAALLILFPILLGVGRTIGVDPIQFGVMVVLNLIIGLCTPPVGVCLFVAAGIGKVTLMQATRAVLPFLAWNLFVLMLVAYVPFVTTWLSGML